MSNLDENLRKQIHDLLARAGKPKEASSPLEPLKVVPDVINELAPLLGSIFQSWFSSGVASQLSQLLSVVATDKAKQQRVYYKALVAEGFTEEQAMLLLLKETDIVEHAIKSLGKKS